MLAVAFAIGIVRNRPPRPAMWWLALAGQVGAFLVMLASAGNLFGLRGWSTFAVIVEAAVLGAVLVLSGLLLVIVRESESTMQRGNRVDALIITVGLGSLWFEYLIYPYLEGGLWPGLLPSATTAFGLILIFAAVRLALARGVPTPAKALLLASASAALLAQVVFHWHARSTGPSDTELLALLASFALQGALVLYLSKIVSHGARLLDDSERRPMLRVAVLTGAALIPVIAEWVHDYLADRKITDESVIVGAAAVLFVLVAFRMKDLMVNINEHRRVVAELKVAELSRVKSLERIAASEEQYRLVVAGSFDSILIVDGQGLVTDCNPAGEAMFGFTFSEIRGREAIGVLFPPNQVRPNLLSTSIGQRVELVGMRADRTKFPIELTVSELRRRHDSLLCVSIRDLTDRMRAEEAKRDSEAKSRFLSTMSHELRTPLNSILGFAQLAEPMVASNPDRRVPAYMKNILVSGWHLLTLINDVLDFSRVQSGELKLNPTKVVLGDLVQSALAKMEPIAKIAGVVVSTKVDPGLVLDVDAVRLEQVLLNLLTNAVKFTSTTVWLEAAQSRDGVSISVVDNGKGIAIQQQERVFEEFVQLESGSTRGYDGAGLGLPISRRFVEAMGGTLQLTSELGAGATFTVWLPVAAVEGGTGESNRATSTPL